VVGIWVQLAVDSLGGLFDILRQLFCVGTHWSSVVRLAAMASNSNNTFNYCPKCDGKLNTRLLCYSCGFTAKESGKYIKVVPDHTKRWYDKPWILTGH
jgi:hypothetical protein